jgi:DNA-binding winged helix-turn-helix (wHTH) protein
MDVQARQDGQDLYDFGEFTLDVPDRRLTRGRASVHLTPKTYDVLVALIRRAGHLTTKHELLESVWPGVYVDEGILTVHVAALRKALGDRKRSPVYIETISRWGYRFIAPVGHRATEHDTTMDGSRGIDREAQL